MKYNYCNLCIYKVFITKIRSVSAVRPGDILVIYRTKPENVTRSAWFISVATSLCVVEEIKSHRESSSCEKFSDYCKKHSVFLDEKLM